MRVLCLMLFLFPLCASAQTGNTSLGSNVTVIQKKWRIETRNPALEKDPISAMQDRENAERRRRDTERTNQILAERGMPTPTTTVSTTTSERGPRGISVAYIYEVKVRNTADKPIQRLTWDYVFLEPGTEIEVGRRQFVSKVKIGPGKVSNVVVRAATSPTRTINASNAGKKPQDQYAEQIVIQRVEYADGSVWQAPRN